MKWQFQIWCDAQPYNFTNWEDCKAFILHRQATRQFPAKIAVRGFTLNHLLFLRSKIWISELIWENNGHAYALHRYVARMYGKLWNIPAGELDDSEVMKQGKGDQILCKCEEPPNI